MKKFFSVVLAVFTAALAFALCGCGDKKKFSFPSSAEEEYERIYSVADGKPFDFTSLSAFSARQTLTLYIPELSALKDTSGKNAYPTTESRIYWFDARNREAIKSQVTDTTVIYNTQSYDKNTVPQYAVPTRMIFATDTLSRPELDHTGKQSEAAVFPTRFASFDDYMASSDSFDAQMQRVTKYPMDLFSAFAGGVSEDGKSYNITATVNSEKYVDFFDIFAEEYSFRKWYTQADGGDRDSRVYENFIDPRFLDSVTVDISSDRDGLTAVSVTMHAPAAAPVPLEGVGEVRLVATTRYSRASKDIGSITVPKYLGSGN